MIVLAVIVATAIISILSWAFLVAVRRCTAVAEELAGHLYESPEPYNDAGIRLLVANHAQEIERLTLAVADGISQVSRAQNRINNAIGRARKELADHGLESPGLEAEYDELRIVDGGAGEAERLPEVSGDAPVPIEQNPSSLASYRYFGLGR